MSAVAPLRSRHEENGQTAPYPPLAVRARNGRVADHPDVWSAKRRLAVRCLFSQ
jgi:hypothetical protein